MEHFQSYLNKSFPNLNLEPPLFYSWPVGIRFQLGINYNPNQIYPGCPYLHQVTKRAHTLYNYLFDDKDQIFFIVDQFSHDNPNSFYKSSNLFLNYIKDQKLRYHLKHKKLTLCDEINDGTNQSQTVDRFSLKCSAHNIRAFTLIEAICNQDMGLRPSVHQRVYFINETKGVIFHVYDDRGCDVLGEKSNILYELYKTFNSWILDYDRPRIDDVFNKF